MHSYLVQWLFCSLWLRQRRKTVLKILKKLKKVSSTIFSRLNQKQKKKTIECYANAYHSSATINEGGTFGSNHYQVFYEFGSQEDNMLDSLHVRSVIQHLVNCFKLIIQPTQKDFVKRGAKISRVNKFLQSPKIRKNFQHH